MKKLIFLLLTFFVLIGCSSKLVEKQQGFVGMANPWTDCGTDLELASQIAGFLFPVYYRAPDTTARRLEQNRKYSRIPRRSERRPKGSTKRKVRKRC